MDGYAGSFELATRIETHLAGTLVHVSVSTADHARLVLDLADHEVLLDASVLLCGTIGARELLNHGYTGPLATRPRLAATERAKASR